MNINISDVSANTINSIFNASKNNNNSIIFTVTPDILKISEISQNEDFFLTVTFQNEFFDKCVSDIGNYSFSIPKMFYLKINKNNNKTNMLLNSNQDNYDTSNIENSETSSTTLKLDIASQKLILLESTEFQNFFIESTIKITKAPEKDIRLIIDPQNYLKINITSFNEVNEILTGFKKICNIYILDNILQISEGDYSICINCESYGRVNKRFRVEYKIINRIFNMAKNFGEFYFYFDKINEIENTQQNNKITGCDVLNVVFRDVGVFVNCFVTVD